MLDVAIDGIVVAQSEHDAIASFMHVYVFTHTPAGTLGTFTTFASLPPSSVRAMTPLTLETFRGRMRDCRDFLYPSVVNFLIMWRLEERRGKAEVAAPFCEINAVP